MVDTNNFPGLQLRALVEVTDEIHLLRLRKPKSVKTMNEVHQVQRVFENFLIKMVD